MHVDGDRAACPPRPRCAGSSRSFWLGCARRA